MINLDDEACTEVMELLGVRTKTDAVNVALRDVLRRWRLQTLLKETADIRVIADPEEHYRAAGR
ncbi:type II toxin-antitoxin system VapB family antitoxin [Catellatospora chokoriensis]|uniref:type II toxin-antitoxin system VapB family antitoxin n=1 Tax=Catellatospora chokoriensis TaxID=310353 RepID=UPI0023B31A12|nr:type II toxin-antitoxin system VapB family antitoxin [Catellatospora chokoriensis]